MLQLNDRVMNTLTRNWWMLVLRGVAALLFGVMAFLYPAAAIGAVVGLFGLYGIVDGILAIVAAGKLGEQCAPWVLTLLSGCVSLLLGLIVFLYPGLPAIALLVVIAIWAALRGLLEIAAAVHLRKLITNEWLLGVGGLISIAFAAVLMYFPFAGSQGIIWLLAAYALVYGALQLGFAHRVHRYKPTAVAAV
jgi:uncharacterized membrane protein HdeD (DUF308 family)